MANYLPANYGQNWGYSGVGQQMYPQYGQSMVAAPQMSYAQTAQANTQGILWVDGEVGAKAYQMPTGWPVNTPIPLWDTNDTIIYLKSTNQMGMPNPLQKIHYKMDETAQKYQSQAMPGENSGQSAADMSEYVRKDEMDRMKQEIMDSIRSIGAGRHEREEA